MDRKTVLIFAIGLLTGAAVAKLIPKEKSIGVLRVDESDPTEEPYLFLELSHDVSTVRKKKRVILDVLDESYLPAK